MTSSNIYEKITNEYLNFERKIQTMTPVKIFENAEHIATVKRLYKHIQSNNPFDDDETNVLSKHNNPLEILAEMFECVEEIDSETFDWMMWDSMDKGIFEDVICEQ